MILPSSFPALGSRSDGNHLYGVYAISYPMQFMVRSQLPDFSRTVITWSIRAIVVIAISLIAAWWLECRLQQRVKYLFT